MEGIACVRIDNDKNKYYCKFKSLNLKKGITVIINYDRGLQFATVEEIIDAFSLDQSVMGEIIRISTKKDYLQHLTNLKDSKIAINKCREEVEKSELPMSIIDASYNFDRSQLLFRFVADSRVDFRKLARDLGAIFKTRIELRQIGIRDKAKEIGGIGPCGRFLCCNSFLKEFDSVSINMAKNQSLSLNPSKINGVCGRLLCCLKYENDNYSNGKCTRKELDDCDS